VEVRQFPIWLCGVFLAACAAAAAAQTLPTASPAPLLSEQLLVQVKGFSFQGNTVFTDQQLRSIAEPLRAKHDGRMSSDDLEAVRYALTLAYVNAGYLNSGAVLPDQTLADGIVRFQIVEGGLAHINVNPDMGGMTMPMKTTAPATQPVGFTPPQPGMQNMAHAMEASSGKGVHLLDENYLKQRVELGAGPPLNVLELKDQLELLRRDPNIQTINAELAPGDNPGESVLNLTTAERNPFQFGVEYSNDRPPSVGAYEMDVLASDSDLTGAGDSLSARWGVLAGAANAFAFDKGNDYSVDYLRPLTARDLTVEINYTRSSDVVVQQPFQSVDIRSKTDSINVTLRQPLLRTVDDPVLKTRDQELAALFAVSSRYNRTFLLGEPFSFSDGVDDGKQDVFALRPALEYVRRSADDALALRTTFSFGVDGPNSTIHSNGTPDGRFFAFLAQSQYVHRIPLGSPQQPWNDTQGVLRFNTQLTPDRLLTLEQFSLGGVNTVRGYEENQLVTDNAVQASAELRVPIIKSAGADWLTVVPFFDSGYAWNRDNRTQTPELIGSVGAGLVFTPDPRVRASVFYGYRLKQFTHNEDDLQDMGIEFDVTILAF
jgi:hemolysin activation/secretion protein